MGTHKIKYKPSEIDQIRFTCDLEHVDWELEPVATIN